MLTPIAPPNYWPLRSTSSTSVTVTAGDGTIVCTNTNNATVAIPSAANLPNRIIVVKKGANNTATVTLDPDGSETIDGATSYVLYVVNDYVVIQSDGSNWQVVGGYLAPHRCSIYEGNGTLIPNNTFTRIPFNGANFDIGGIGDIVTDGRVEIRRSGYYLIFGTFQIVTTNPLDVAQFQVWVNGSAVRGSNLNDASHLTGGTNNGRAICAMGLFLSAGDYVDVYGYQINSSSNSYTTPTTAQGRPTLEVLEHR